MRLPDQQALWNGGGALDRRRIGYLPEERGLFEDASVARMLAYLGTLRGTRGPGHFGGPPAGSFIRASADRRSTTARHPARARAPSSAESADSPIRGRE
jgi:hypothetical protein